MEVSKHVGQRGGGELRVQPVVVEEHVLAQLGDHAALDEVVRQLGQFARVIAHLSTPVHRQRAERQRLLAYLRRRTVFTRYSPLYSRSYNWLYRVYAASQVQQSY